MRYLAHINIKIRANSDMEAYDKIMNILEKSDTFYINKIGEFYNLAYNIFMPEPCRKIYPELYKFKTTDKHSPLEINKLNLLYKAPVVIGMFADNPSELHTKLSTLLTDIGFDDYGILNAAPCRRANPELYKDKYPNTRSLMTYYLYDY